LTLRSYFPDLSACIIFYDEWEQVEACIRSFKRFYPDGQVILARDTLPPKLPDNLRKFNCSLVPQNGSMGYLVDLARQNKSLDDLNLKQRLKIINSQIQKLQDISRVNKSGHILFLEYDSYVRRKVPVFFDSDIETIEANKFSVDFVALVEKITCRKLPFSGWGFVTGTVNSNSLRDALLWYKVNRKIVSKIATYEPKLVVLDFLVPILVHLSGGKVGNNNLTTECYRDKFWRWRGTPLLHQYRAEKRKYRFLMSRSFLDL